MQTPSFLRTILRCGPRIQRPAHKTLDRIVHLRSALVLIREPGHELLKLKHLYRQGYVKLDYKFQTAEIEKTIKINGFLQCIRTGDNTGGAPHRVPHRVPHRTVFPVFCLFNFNNL